MKILIVEDEAELVNIITGYFAKEGYICEIASNCREADEKLFMYHYDCILLDISLPDGNGLELLDKIKNKKETGVIIISAKNSIDDKIKGLKLGADDYISKPFHLSELNARVSALLRRIKFGGSDQVEVGDLKIDLDKRNVFVKEKEVILNRKEYELLLFFVSNKERVIKKTSISEHLWGDSIDQNDSFDFLYSQIKNLRKKFSDIGYKFNIQTVYGIGYKFIPE